MKKGIFKKALCGILAMLMVVAIVPFSASTAADDVYTGNMIQHTPQFQQYYINGASIAATGCGILSLVNCVGFLTGKKMDVIEVAEWAYSIGSFNVTYGGDGTYRLALYPRVTAKYGSKYGFSIDCGSDNEGWWDGSYSSTLQNHLMNGGVAIGHVPGHFIAIVGYESGKYHIYESSPSDARGTNYNGGDVWVTPAQLASGRLCLDWFCLVSANEKDTKAPVISDVSITDLSASGYTINCIVKDDFYVERVSFPTWTTKNNQDDLPGQFFITQNGKRSGNIFTFRVNSSAHNYETGEYITHIYATDRGGNRTCYEMEPVIVRDDNVNPVISDVQILNLSSKGYTVKCKVTDDLGVHKVSFPTWTTYNNQDDLAEQFLYTQLGTKDGDYYTFEVKASDHNNETGEYMTHIYAIDNAGNMVCYEVDPIDVRDVVAEKIKVKASSEYGLDGTLLKNIKAGETVEDVLGQLESGDLKAFDKDGNAISGSALVGTGSVIKLYANGLVVDSVTVVILGDVDGTGIIDGTDYIRVKSLFLETFKMNSIEEAAADVDGTGKIDATDYMKIKSHFLGTYNLYA